MELQLWYSNIFFGRKGAGKTQMAVIQAYYAWKRWDIIISNIWLDFPHIRFYGGKDLPPILKEISQYCGDHVMSVEAPSKMLREYGLTRKKMKLNNFFILFDEIGNHLNNRSWNSNFKDPLLRDMLTEPRKYKLTIVWVCQSTDDVDIAFLRACEDWFLFSKKWSGIFLRFHYTHFWVINWKLDFTNEIYILERGHKFAVFWKMLSYFRELYWTGEIVGAGAKGNAPHRFNEWNIYASSYALNVPPVSLLEKKPREMSESEYGGAVGIPRHENFTTKNIQNVDILEWSWIQGSEVQTETPKKRWRPRKSPL
jgi:hypothetical protein